MKAVCFTNKGMFQVKNIPEPQLDHLDDVKIKIAYSGFCGDDVRILRGDLGSVAEDHVLGDEMSGVIVDLSDRAYDAGFRVGDRVSALARIVCGHCVFCMTGRQNACINSIPEGMMKEYVVFRYQQICRLPNSVDLKTGSLLPLVATCVSCVENANIHMGDNVILFGAGGFGLVLLQLLLRSGAAGVTVVEPVEAKRMLALQYGAHHVIDPVTENVCARSFRITDGVGYNTVIDASGSMEGFNDGICVASNLSTIVTLSIYHSDFKYRIDMMDLLWRQLTLRAVRSPSPQTMPRANQLLDQLKLDTLTAKIFPIDEMANAYKAYTTGLFPKVIIALDETLNLSTSKKG